MFVKITIVHCNIEIYYNFKLSFMKTKDLNELKLWTNEESKKKKKKTTTKIQNIRQEPTADQKWMNWTLCFEIGV